MVKAFRAVAVFALLVAITNLSCENLFCMSCRVSVTCSVLFLFAEGVFTSKIESLKHVLQWLYHKCLLMLWKHQCRIKECASWAQREAQQDMQFYTIGCSIRCKGIYCSAQVFDSQQRTEGVEQGLHHHQITVAWHSVRAGKWGQKGWKGHVIEVLVVNRDNRMELQGWGSREGERGGGGGGVGGQGA